MGNSTRECRNLFQFPLFFFIANGMKDGGENAQDEWKNIKEKRKGKKIEGKNKEET